MSELSNDLIRKLKGEVFERAFEGVPEPKDAREKITFWIHGQRVFIRWYPGEIAYIVDEGGNIYSPSEAQKLIQWLTNFYDRVDDLDIEILNLEYKEEPKTKAADKSSYTKGYVYLLREVNGSHYKIGCTSKPEDRLHTFSVKLPYKVEYDALIATDDMYALENELHGQFASKRVDGEWFELEPGDVGYIKSLAGQS